MALESNLIKLPIVEGAEFRRQPTEGPDKPELHTNNVNNETEPYLLRELEAFLGFTLHLYKRISRGEKVRVHVVVAVRRETEVSALVRGLERPMYQVPASPDMFRPWHDVTSETHISPGLEAPQSASFDQFIAKLTESKSSIVVAEVWAG
jgi:hypothetical protein